MRREGAQEAVRTRHGDDLRDARRQLVMSYKIASSTLSKFDATNVAWLAADRAMTVATGADDPLCLTQATRAVARAMAKAGQPAEATGMLIQAAGRGRPDAQASPRLRSAYGMLLLAAESAAADTGDGDTALRMHEHAAATARELGDNHKDALTAFGIANVAIHRVAALVRLRESTRALDLAAAVPPAMLNRLPRERTASFQLDLAAAYEQRGQFGEAGRRIVAADQIAEEEVRCPPSARALVGRALEARSLPASSGLHGIARRMGIQA